MRVFLDTNILLSAALFPEGVAAAAYDRAVSAPNDAVVSGYVVDELRSVFARKFSRGRQRRWTPSWLGSPARRRSSSRRRRPMRRRVCATPQTGPSFGPPGTPRPRSCSPGTRTCSRRASTAHGSSLRATSSICWPGPTSRTTTPCARASLERRRHHPVLRREGHLLLGYHGPRRAPYDVPLLRRVL